MSNGSRTRGDRHDRTRRHYLVLVVILRVRQTQRMTGDAVIVISEPGNAQNAGDHDRQPDAHRAVCDTQRNECRNNKEQSLKRSRQNNDHYPNSKKPCIARLLCPRDADPRASNQSAADCRHCPSPVAVHPVTEKTKIHTNEYSKKRPAGWQPTLQRTTKRSSQQTRAQADAKPRMPEEDLSQGHSKCLRWWKPRGASGFFFFSSRRRHTRFDCDWSSDVCSSD